MVYTINQRRAAFAGLLVCLIYDFFICIQLGFYSHDEVNLGASGYWNLAYVSGLVFSLILTSIRLYSIVLDISQSDIVFTISIFVYASTFLFMLIAESTLIINGYFPPVTPLQWHVFICFWVCIALIAICFIIYMTWSVYLSCKRKCSSSTASGESYGAIV